MYPIAQWHLISPTRCEFGVREIECLIMSGCHGAYVCSLLFLSLTGIAFTNLDFSCFHHSWSSTSQFVTYYLTSTYNESKQLSENLLIRQVSCLLVPGFRYQAKLLQGPVQNCLVQANIKAPTRQAGEAHLGRKKSVCHLSSELEFGG